MRYRLLSNRGVTFVELMIGVVIIGIITTMAVPRFGAAFERIRFRTINRDIVTSLRVARSMAITDKSPYGVHFDPAGKLVTVFKKDPSSTDEDAFETADSIVRVDTLSGHIYYLGTDMTDAAVVYQPNGSARFAGGGNIVTLTYTENTIGIYNINVLASTGRVKSVGYYY